MNKDLHGGNIMGNSFIDWGNVVCVPPEHLQEMMELVLLMASSDDIVLQAAKAKELFSGLLPERTLKKVTPATWEACVKLLNIATVATGKEDVTELVEHTRCLSEPSWLTGSIQACGCIGSSISVLMQKEPQVDLNEIIKQSILSLPPVAQFQKSPAFTSLQVSRAEQGLNSPEEAKIQLDDALKNIGGLKVSFRLGQVFTKAMALAVHYTTHKDQVAIAERLVESCTSLHGLILKGLQHFGTRSDLPEGITNEFIKVIKRTHGWDSQPTLTEAISALGTLLGEQATNFTVVKNLKTGTVASCALVASDDGKQYVLKFIPDDKEELFKTDLAAFPHLSGWLDKVFIVLEKLDPKLGGVRKIVNLLIDVLANPIFGLELLEEFNLEREGAKLEAANELMKHLSSHGSVVGVPHVLKHSKNALLMTLCEGSPLSD
jgi:predicted unusual protein kinase regulating ubiquinone biosynthesis (AarF/ABC1/UbiB family)